MHSTRCSAMVRSAGSLLGRWRMLRCHPWCEGGCDPVPARLPWPRRRLFTRLLGRRSEQPPPGEQTLPKTRKLT
jgi:hypothetical protein